VVGGAEGGGEAGGAAIGGERREDEVGGGGLVEAVNLAGALVGGEEEDLPLVDGTAERGAELVLFEVGLGLSGGVEEEGVGVEDVIADELPGVAVEVLLAGFGDESGRGDLRAVDGVILRGVDLEFGDGVGVGDSGGGEGAVEGIGAGAGVAVDVDAACAASERTGVVDVGGGAGGHGQDLGEVAGGEGNGGDGLGVDEDSGGRRQGSEVAAARDGVIRVVAGVEDGVEGGGFGDADDDIGEVGGFEAGGGEAGFVGSGREESEPVRAGCDGGRGLDLGGGGVGEGNGSCRDGVVVGAFQIARESSGCRGLCLEEGMASQEKQKNEAKGHGL